MEHLSWPLALERYTQLVPQEALRVEVEQDGEPDTILIFRGFSSSLVRATPSDPNQPVIQAQARFISLERLQAPFNPANPVILAADLDAAATTTLLHSAGIEALGLG